MFRWNMRNADIITGSVERASPPPKMRCANSSCKIAIRPRRTELSIFSLPRILLLARMAECAGSNIQRIRQGRASFSPTNTLGTQYDRGWNAGADLGIRLTPELRATVGYNYEEHSLYMQSCCGGAAYLTTAINGAARSRRNTIPLSLQLSGTQSLVNSTFWATTYLHWGPRPTTQSDAPPTITNCTGKFNPTDPAVVWPTEKNTFQRFNVVAKYYVDPSVVKQMGFVGNVTLKARYTLEQNHSDNWAINNFTPYSPSADDLTADITNGGRSFSSRTTTRTTRRRSLPSGLKGNPMVEP